jgi:PmbA protein
MFDVVDDVLEIAARSGARDAEAFAERATSRRIKVYKQEVEELTAARRKGVGLRVFQEGAVGHAYSSDTAPRALEDLVERALGNASVTDPDPFARLPQPLGEPPVVSVYDPRLEGRSEDEKIDLALRVEKAALDYDPRVKLVEDTVYADGEAEVFLASSGGVRGTYRENSAYVFAYVLAEEHDQVETGLSFSVGRDLAQLDAEGCGREAAQRAVDLLGARKCPSMKATVVLDPFVAASFFGVLSSALTAEAVQKGRSLFASLEGERVASEAFGLVDDALHPEGLASAPFDGEGTPSQRTTLVAEGVLQGFLYDTYTGNKAGRPSTGNGVRGSYSSLPAVQPTNLVVVGPTTPVAEIVAGIRRGVLVTNAVGVHSGANPISGEFSVGINGRLIEGGRLTGGVREVTLAGDLLGMLKGIVALGDDARWIPTGSILTPSIVMEGMAIGGA